MDREGSFRAIGARLALAVVALGGATCGGNGGRSIPFDDLAGELLNAECDFLVACGSALDRTTCLASLDVDGPQFATLKADIAAGTVAYNGQAAGACIDLYKTLSSCKQTVVGNIGPRIDAICGKVFTGLLPPGSTCFYREECANQGACDGQTCSANGCCAGTCVARPTPIPLGGDCSSPLLNQDCIDGTVCAANATGGGSCKVPLAAGAPCGPYDRCVLPYQCGGIDLLSGEGTCNAPPGQGQACDMSGNCDDSRDYCDRTTNVCTSRIAVGSPCSAPEVCVLYATCDGTTCIAPPGPGSSCDPASVDPCSLSLSCDTTMHCSLPPTPAACR